MFLTPSPVLACLICMVESFLTVKHIPRHRSEATASFVLAAGCQHGQAVCSRSHAGHHTLQNLGIGVCQYVLALQCGQEQQCSSTQGTC
jgi:hypothetical protein